MLKNSSLVIRMTLPITVVGLCAFGIIVAFIAGKAGSLVVPVSLISAVSLAVLTVATCLVTHRIAGPLDRIVANLVRLVGSQLIDSETRVNRQRQLALSDHTLHRIAQGGASSRVRTVTPLGSRKSEPNPDAFDN